MFLKVPRSVLDAYTTNELKEIVKEREEIEKISEESLCVAAMVRQHANILLMFTKHEDGTSNESRQCYARTCSRCYLLGVIEGRWGYERLRVTINIECIEK